MLESSTSVIVTEEGVTSTFCSIPIKYQSAIVSVSWRAYIYTVVDFIARTMHDRNIFDLSLSSFLSILSNFPTTGLPVDDTTFESKFHSSQSTSGFGFHTLLDQSLLRQKYRQERTWLIPPHYGDLQSHCCYHSSYPQALYILPSFRLINRYRIGASACLSSMIFYTIMIS